MNNNHNISSNNPNTITKFKNKDIDPEIKPNKFISFLSSKTGIIIIIITTIVIVSVVVLSVTLSKKNGNVKDENNEQEKDPDNPSDKGTDEDDNDYMYKGKILSDTLYVKKIENLPKDFILGMDLSSVIAEENSGVKYYNFNNEEKDIFEILRYVGINYIRVRIWNDPFDSEGHGYGGGNNDMEVAIKIGKRATKYGMKILASFHYSDFYADPGSQNVPKAWRGLDLEEKTKKAEEFTIASLTRFKNEGVDVGMVALGNEINDFFCGETEWPNIVKILNACCKATRQVLPNTLVSVHFTNPEREGSMMYFANSLNANNLDYDICSVSYYNVWAGGINCLDRLNEVADL